MAPLKFAPQNGDSGRTLAVRGVAQAHRSERADRPEGIGIAGSGRVEHRRPTIAHPLARGERLPLGDADAEMVTVVKSGSIALFAPLPGNRSVCVGILGPGDLVLNDRSGDERVVAEALTDAVLIREELERLVGVLSGSPHLIHAALSSLRRQTIEMRGLIARLLSRDISLRLAVMLTTLAERFGSPNEDGTVAITIPVAHKMLARMIGSNRVTVTRVMTDLRDQGMARAPGRNRIVVDPVRLRSRLDAI